MNRTGVVLSVLTAVLVASGAVGATASQGDGVVRIRTVDDVVIGESTQRIEGMRVVGFDEDVEELVVELDVTVLTHHGIDIGDASVDIHDENVEGASIDSATVADGVVTLVLVPENTGIFVSEFRLTGLDTAAAENATDVTYDVSFSAGDGDVSSFDIVSPDDVTPSASMETLVLDDGTQWVTIEGIRPLDGNVTVELDLTVLETYGIATDNLGATVESDEATVRTKTVSGGVISILLTPAEDTESFTVELELSGFEAPSLDPDERAVASNVAYEIRFEGVAEEDVDVEPFDVVTEPPTPTFDPTPTIDPTPTSSPVRSPVTEETSAGSEDAPGFGWMVALIALAVVGLHAARQR
ncbi:MAG: hypothetical protein V5A62_01970 [Haloarculaceae archaeon]